MGHQRYPYIPSPISSAGITALDTVDRQTDGVPAVMETDKELRKCTKEELKPTASDCDDCFEGIKPYRGGNWECIYPLLPTAVQQITLEPQ